MVKPSLIKEYDPLGKSEICCDLVGLEKYLKRNNLSSVLKISPSGIKANYHVGIIKYKTFQLQILPKLIAEEENNEEQILKNLIFMLSYTKKLDIKTTDNVNLSKSQNPFLEILIKEFANSLFEALKRLTPKNYVREEDNLNFLKGKIKFSENIRYNCVNQAKFYCEFDEFSENNILNQLFLYVATSLYEVSKNSENKRVLKLIIDYFAGVKIIRFDKFKCEKIRLTRNQKLFEKPFNLAKMFVENSSVDLSLNKFDSISFVWDMNKLFEEFIYQVLRKMEGVSVTAQQKRHLLKHKEGFTRRDTKVDIMVNNKIVLDTKYKRFESLDDVKNADIFQVSTYCMLHAKNQAILLYPQWGMKKSKKTIDLEYCLNANNEDKKEQNNKNDNKENNQIQLKFVSVNLRLDLKKDLRDLKNSSLVKE